MEEQFLMGRSLREMGENPGSQMQALMEQLGLDDMSELLGLGSAMAFQFVYNAIPNPPVSRAAPLASTVAARAPSDGADRISALPDEILLDVVSRLPAKDAARTGALASRWRGLWRSVPLVLVDADIVPESMDAERVMPGGDDILSMVVVLQASAVLAAHPGPFRCVHLTRGHMASHKAEAEAWLQLLAAKGVQELVFINRPWPLDFPLPAALFDCGAALTRLHLGAWKFPDTRSLLRSAGFPHLRELTLSMIVIRDRDLAFLLERSPVLEKLTIISVQTGLRLRVVSRNLRCLQLGMSIIQDVTVVDAPRLERLLLWMTARGHKCPRIKIGHAPNLRMLGYWQADNDQQHCHQDTRVSPSTVIASVQVLALEVHFEVRNEIKMMPCFLKCFPNVETLHIFSLKTDKPSGKLNLKFWQEAGHIECVRRPVKKFILHEFRGKKSEIAFLQFIAERAQVLKKMVVMVASQCFSSADDVNAKLKPLTSAEWASKEYKLIIFKSQSSDGASPPWSFRLASDFSLEDPFDLMTADAELNSGATVLHCCRTL